METKLDIRHWEYWFLEEFNYFDYELELVVAEGITSSENDENAPVPGARIVEAQPESRRFKIAFEHVLLFRVIDESYIKEDSEAVSSKGVLQKFEKSEFLIFAKEKCDFWAHDNYSHYRLKTTNEFIDIISTEAPEIKETSSYHRSSSDREDHAPAETGRSLSNSSKGVKF
jgi:hypothetical protein